MCIYIYIHIHVYIYIYICIIGLSLSLSAGPADDIGWPSFPGRLLTRKFGRDQRDFRQRDCTESFGVMRFVMLWTTLFSSFECTRELGAFQMRGFACWEKQPQSGALGAANQQPASWVSLGPTCGFPWCADFPDDLVVWLTVSLPSLT